MGIPKELFVDVDAEILSELLCGVCKAVAEEPKVHNSCGRVFCTSCIDPWLISKKTARCPVDGQAISTTDQMKPTRFFTKSYNNLKLWCPFQEKGCEQPVMRLELFAEHRKECGFNPENPKDCDGGCGAKLKLNERQDHSCVTYLKEELAATRRELEQGRQERAQNAAMPQQLGVGAEGGGENGGVAGGSQALTETDIVSKLVRNVPNAQLVKLKECVMKALQGSEQFSRFERAEMSAQQNLVLRFIRDRLEFELMNMKGGVGLFWRSIVWVPSHGIYLPLPLNTSYTSLAELFIVPLNLTIGIWKK